MSIWNQYGWRIIFALCVVVATINFVLGWPQPDWLLPIWAWRTLDIVTYALCGIFAFREERRFRTPRQMG